MKVEQETIKGYNDSIIPYTLLTNEEKTSTLGIILPGMGYTTQAPLLHYATGLLLREGCDVLQINYQYKNDVFRAASDEEQNEWINNDVQTVITTILNQHDYTNFVIVAKSIGTIPLANELKTRSTFSQAKAIWLTPLLTEHIVYEKMLTCMQDSLVVIGDKDHFYEQERVLAVSNLDNMHTVVIPNANHSLEDEYDLLISIDRLKEIVKEMYTFIQKGVKE
ncbi:MAG: alpha/beta family hydrolase [Bacillaceae bacterium]